MKRSWWVRVRGAIVRGMVAQGEMRSWARGRN